MNVSKICVKSVLKKFYINLRGCILSILYAGEIKSIRVLNHIESFFENF